MFTFVLAFDGFSSKFLLDYYLKLKLFLKTPKNKNVTKNKTDQINANNVKKTRMVLFWVHVGTYFFFFIFNGFTEIKYKTKHNLK